MKLHIIEKRKKEPRYILLKFALNHFTKNGKKGLKNNREYIEFHKRMNLARSSNILYIVKHFLLAEFTYDTYSFIYDEMVKVGYKGERPVFTHKPLLTPSIPLYSTKEFLDDNPFLFM